jgi:DNA-binding MarR family transcriptional regulator
MTRARPDDDRRSVYLSLTHTGQHLYSEVFGEQLAWCRKMLAALDPLERNPFIAAMVKIAAYFQK